MGDSMLSLNAYVLRAWRIRCNLYLHYIVKHCFSKDLGFEMLHGGLDHLYAHFPMQFNGQSDSRVKKKSEL